MNIQLLWDCTWHDGMIYDRGCGPVSRIDKIYGDKHTRCLFAKFWIEMIYLFRLYSNQFYEAKLLQASCKFDVYSQRKNRKTMVDMGIMKWYMWQGIGFWYVFFILILIRRIFFTRHRICISYDHSSDWPNMPRADTGYEMGWDRKNNTDSIQILQSRLTCYI